MSRNITNFIFGAVRTQNLINYRRSFIALGTILVCKGVITYSKKKRISNLPGVLLAKGTRFVFVSFTMLLCTSSVIHLELFFVIEIIVFVFTSFFAK
jgi:hypothetical protein